MKCRAMKPARSSGASSSASVRPMQLLGHDVEQRGSGLRCEADREVGVDCDDQVARVFGQHAKALARFGVAPLDLGVGRQHQAPPVGQVHRHRARHLVASVAPRRRRADQQMPLCVGEVQRDSQAGEQLRQGFELRVGHVRSRVRWPRQKVCAS